MYLYDAWRMGDDGLLALSMLPAIQAEDDPGKLIVTKCVNVTNAAEQSVSGLPITLHRCEL